MGAGQCLSDEGDGKRAVAPAAAGRLEGKAPVRSRADRPSQAINIGPLFAAAHPPLIEREMWVDVNVMQIHNMGAEGWLRQLLDVLNGDIVTAEEVGFAPPGGLFGYGAPSRSKPQRRGKKETEKKTPHLGVWAWLPCQLFEPSEGSAVMPVETHTEGNARRARLARLPGLGPD